MVVAASRNHLYRRRLQVVIDAGPRNHLYLLGQQVKIRSCPRNHLYFLNRINEWVSDALTGGRLALRRQRQDSGKAACPLQATLGPLPAFGRIGLKKLPTFCDSMKADAGDQLRF